MQKTSISWTNYSSNPIRAVNIETGKEGWFCSKVSDGCTNCYAEAINMRYGNQLQYNLASVVKARFILKEKEFEQWNKIPKGSKVFICDMTDFFHENMPIEFQQLIFAQMANHKDLIFQVLTKRPILMGKFIQEYYGSVLRTPDNIWLGTSVESKKFPGRLTALYHIPAKVHFASFEPLLESIADLVDLSGLEWAIVGAESGNHRRHFDPKWAIELRDLCKINGVAFYYKQGSHRFSDRERFLEGKLYEEFPKIAMEIKI